MGIPELIYAGFFAAVIISALVTFFYVMGDNNSKGPGKRDE